MNESISLGGSEHVHDRLSDFLNGDLPDAERQVVQTHIESCAECRGDLESLRVTVQVLRQMPLQPVPRSFTIATPDPRRSTRLLWLRWSSGVLAATFVALLALRVVLPTAQPASAPSAGTATNTVAARAPIAPAAPTSAPAAMPAATTAPLTRPQIAAAQPVPPTAASTAAPAAAPARPGAAATPTEELHASGVAPFSSAASQAALPPTNSSAAASASTSEKAAPRTTAKPSVQENAAVARPTTAPAVPRDVGTQPIARQTSSQPLPASPGLPGWFTPLLVVVGVLFTISLGALVWTSRRP